MRDPDSYFMEENQLELLFNQTFRYQTGVSIACLATALRISNGSHEKYTTQFKQNRVGEGD
ncbi:hypothetical protein M493_17107 [Geobacillus genomosp. 3]|uniref:Uncharacterized protein n=1 Tax=Geobacillus genomosp. 3 TaxID=1921421 RepID=V5LYJ4_GEOG3|nr:hypothetical protein M493_17107 [Geobacillus genomosp. 3]